ncbi:MAG: DedA family protein [Terracidiphilus sp.]|jgi:membrane protein DedA with SNARE-associated domain
MHLIGADFIARHGVPWIVAAAFAERFGAPIFVTPLLVAAGVLAARGDARLGTVFLAITVACLVGDCLWYEVTRWKGMGLLKLLCRISFVPDSYVRRANAQLMKHVGLSLLGAKWLPGFAHLTVPLAGAAHVPRSKFHLYNTVGTGVWAGALLTAGFLSARGIDWTGIVRISAGWAIGLALTAMVITTAKGYYRRVKYLKTHSLARKWREGRKRKVGRWRVRGVKFFQSHWARKFRASES